jgi:hypothetical protein
MTPWEFTGSEITNCNCDYGCPCQFDALPTHGNCHATFGVQIDKGHFGDVKLDGLRFAGIFAWPGAVHQGNGEAIAIIDESATPEQRDALLKILSGQDTDPFATIFAIFATTISKMHEPVFTKIEMSIDIDSGKGRLHVPNYLDTEAEPIRNKTTGAPSRAQIVLPAGFEYTVAEVVSGKSKTKKPMILAMNDTHAHLARMHFNNHGVVR